MNALLTPLSNITPWLAQLAAKKGRDMPSVQAQGLLATDFPLQGALLQTEDGSLLAQRHAFWVQDLLDASHVAVFTEHLGYPRINAYRSRAHQRPLRAMLRTWSPGTSSCCRSASVMRLSWPAWARSNRWQDA